MPALRHPRGRGLLLDDAEANSATFISRDSCAKDSAKLRDCKLYEGSIASGECQIYGGRFHNSTVTGRTIVAGNPCIRNSHADCSEVSGNTHIGGATLLGNTEICDSAIIIKATARDAIIYGKCDIEGSFEVTGRIHEGYWTRPPKHVKLPWCDLSECVDGKLLLDCWCRPVEWWLRFGPQKALDEWEWNQDQVDITIGTIRKEFIPRRTLLPATGKPLSQIVVEDRR